MPAVLQGSSLVAIVRVAAEPVDVIQAERQSITCGERGRNRLNADS
jgi:hypothetical protein